MQGALRLAIAGSALKAFLFKKWFDEGVRVNLLIFLELLEAFKRGGLPPRLFFTTTRPSLNYVRLPS
jgi:hypothetical protein